MNTAWDHILDKDETILWQGRPDGALHFRLKNVGTFIFGLFFAGFALFWMVMASQAGGFFWMFGLIHFSVGIGVSFGSLFYDVYRRRHTWYTLTDRRAFIATDMVHKGRQLKSYPITKDMMLKFQPGPLPSIHFAQEVRRSNNGSRPVDIGFDWIADGDEVIAMIRQIQRGTP